jgi:hypothetical protein
MIILKLFIIKIMWRTESKIIFFHIFDNIHHLCFKIYYFIFFKVFNELLKCSLALVLTEINKYYY